MKQIFTTTFLLGAMALSSAVAQAAPSSDKFDEYAPDMSETFSTDSGSLNGPFENNQPPWLEQLEAAGCNHWGLRMCWEEEVKVTSFACAPTTNFDPSQCLGLPPGAREICLMQGRRSWVGLECPSTEIRSWSFDEETCKYTYEVIFESPPVVCQPAPQSDITHFCQSSGGLPPPTQEIVGREWPVSCK